MTTLIVTLKIFSGLLFVITAVVIALMVFPVTLHSASSFCAESNLEEGLNCLLNDKDEQVDLVFVDCEFEVSISVLLGLVSIYLSEVMCPKIRVFGLEIPIRLQKSDRKLLIADKRKSIRFRKERLSELIRFPLRAKTKTFIKTLIEATNLDVNLALEFGFFDSANTGILFGLFSAFIGAVGIKGVKICPNFEKQLISVSGTAFMKIVPVQLLWIGIRFALEPEVRNLWRKKESSIS